VPEKQKIIIWVFSGVGLFSSVYNNSLSLFTSGQELKDIVAAMMATDERDKRGGYKNVLADGYYINKLLSEIATLQLKCNCLLSCYVYNYYYYYYYFYYYYYYYY